MGVHACVHVKPTITFISNTNYSVRCLRACAYTCMYVFMKCDVHLCLRVGICGYARLFMCIQECVCGCMYARVCVRSCQCTEHA